jgi:hypothetical protein
MVSTGTPQRSETFSLGDQREGGDHTAAIGHLEAAHELWCRIGRERRHGRVRMAVPHEGGILGVADEETIIGTTLVLDDEPGRVGVAEQIFAINLLGSEKLVDQRADEQPVGAGADADPFVSNRRVAGADRIDRNDLGPPGLELAQSLLDGV